MIAPAPPPTPADFLTPHTQRVIRRFLQDHEGDHLERAVFDLAYQGIDNVPAELATALEAELSNSTKRIGDLIDGWRPASIRRHLQQP